jgi:hypothetical protein
MAAANLSRLVLPPPNMKNVPPPRNEFSLPHLPWLAPASDGPAGSYLRLLEGRGIGFTSPVSLWPYTKALTEPVSVFAQRVLKLVELVACSSSDKASAAGCPSYAKRSDL